MTPRAGPGASCRAWTSAVPTGNRCWRRIRAWYRPIGLLGEDDFGPEQDALTRTPAQRAELALQIPEAVLGMHSHWLPLRLAIHERAVAQTLQAKVGRNEPCPCGSGKKFKKCCGAPADLH